MIAVEECQEDAAVIAALPLQLQNVPHIIASERAICCEQRRSAFCSASLRSFRIFAAPTTQIFAPSLSPLRIGLEPFGMATLDGPLLIRISLAPLLQLLPRLFFVTLSPKLTGQFAPLLAIALVIIPIPLPNFVTTLKPPLPLALAPNLRVRAVVFAHGKSRFEAGAIAALVAKVCFPALVGRPEMFSGCGFHDAALGARLRRI